MSIFLVFIFLAIGLTAILKLGSHIARLNGINRKEKYPWYDLSIFGAMIWCMITIVWVTVLAFLLIIPSNVYNIIVRNLNGIF